MIAQVPKKFKTESTVPKVDCTNDSQMVRAGLRPAPLVYDAEWHRKTPEERYYLNRVVKIKGVRVTSGSKIIRTVPHRITVHLNNLQKSPTLKTTYSTVIYKDQIQEYMGAFFSHCKDKIKKVYYNGKDITSQFSN